jgi:hypothetical protein
MNVKPGTKILLIHAVSRWQEALRVVWLAGQRWQARRISESELGEDYIVLQVQN